MSAIDEIRQRIRNREGLKRKPNAFEQEYFFNKPQDVVSQTDQLRKDIGTAGLTLGIMDALNSPATLFGRPLGYSIGEQINMRTAQEHYGEINKPYYQKVPEYVDQTFRESVKRINNAFDPEVDSTPLERASDIGLGVVKTAINTIMTPMNIVTPASQDIGRKVAELTGSEGTGEVLGEVLPFLVMPNPIAFFAASKGSEYATNKIMNYLENTNVSDANKERLAEVIGLGTFIATHRLLTKGVKYSREKIKDLLKKEIEIKTAEITQTPPTAPPQPKGVPEGFEQVKPLQQKLTEPKFEEVVPLSKQLKKEVKTGIQEVTSKKTGRKYYYDYDKKAPSSKKKFEEQKKEPPNVTEGIKPKEYFEDVSNVSKLADKIVKSEKLTDADLQLQKNYPKELETELKKKQEEQKKEQPIAPVVEERPLTQTEASVKEIASVEDFMKADTPEITNFVKRNTTPDEFNKIVKDAAGDPKNLTPVEGKTVVDMQAGAIEAEIYNKALDIVEKKEPSKPTEVTNESAIQRMLTEGKSNEDIAKALNITAGDVTRVKFGLKNIKAPGNLTKEGEVPTRTVIERPSPGRLISEEIYKKDTRTIQNAPLTFAADPQVQFAYLRAGAYHLENIIRAGIDKSKRFTEWSNAMLKSFGEGVKKNLLSIWSGVKKVFGKDVENIKPEPPKNPNEVRAQNVASKMTDAIKGSKKVRGETEKLRAVERSKRAGQLRGALEKGKGGGEETLLKALGTQKGELPKADFEPIKITEADVTDAFKSIWNSERLNAYEQLNAGIGLKKVLGKEGGQIPTPYELGLLEKVFGGDFVKELISKRTNWEKFKEGFLDVINLPRSMMSSVDFSATFRQGLVLTVGYPKKAFNTFFQSVKAFGSDKIFQEVAKNIEGRKNTELYDESGLYLSGKGEAVNLAAREEAFMSRLKDRIPILGALIKASERAYLTYLNKMRADVFDTVTDAFISDGITPKNNPKAFKDLASFINNASGRGSLGKYGERIAPVLNGVFFSPRNLMAKLNLLNPVMYAKLDPAVRKVAMKNMFKLVGAGVTVLSLAKLSGAQVEVDPRSSDFGKIKIGNTRIDIWGGFQQPIRFFTQILMGQYKSTSDGTIYELDGKKFPFTNRGDLVLRFFGQKFSPQMRIAADVLRGETQMGEELKLSEEVYSNLTPLYIQDAIEAYNELGWGSVALTAPAILGVGTQTYESKQKGRLIQPQIQETEIKQPIIKETQ